MLSAVSEMLFVNAVPGANFEVPTRRPRRDRRQVLAGIVGVLGTGSSWRDLPEEEFGPWLTVYGRYRRGQEEDLWQRIMEALRPCQ